MPGDRSIWYTWHAPTNGIATFHTRGSTCDTLLAVYTGTNLATVDCVASDDNGGGFYTSAVQFNARAGTDYAIAVDAVVGEQGTFLLTWSLEVTDETLPVLLSTPSSQTIPLGGTASFSVTTDSTNATYQWLFQGEPIAGATASNLILTNVQLHQTGNYSVRVSNSHPRFLWVGADLQIGSCPAAGLYDKILSQLKLACAAGPGRGPERDGGTVTNLPTQGFVAVGLGSSDFASGDITDAGGSTEVSCGGWMANSKWLGLQPTTNGILAIDTSCSAVLTRVRIYALPLTNPFPSPGRVVACDFTSADRGAPARLWKFVEADTNFVYAVEVGGAGNAGRVRVDYQLLPPDTFLLFQRLCTNGVEIEITCCTTNPAFTLEAASCLASNGWETVTNYEGPSRDFLYTATILTDTNRFYRARYQRGAGGP
jgi:hypothetical protein